MERSSRGRIGKSLSVGAFSSLLFAVSVGAGAVELEWSPKQAEKEKQAQKSQAEEEKELTDKEVMKRYNPQSINENDSDQKSTSGDASGQGTRKSDSD